VRRSFADTVAVLRRPRPSAVQLLSSAEPDAKPSDGLASQSGSPRSLESVVEDQTGTTGLRRDYLSRSTTVVAFFYTRCQNPNKCSTTITKLAHLQRELATASPRTQVAAITYDPGYDSPDRLLRYGTDRGMLFSDGVRMFRTVTDHVQLQTFFGLRVGYNGSIINRHGIELFLVAADLGVPRTWARIQWQVNDVVSAVARHEQNSAPSEPVHSSQVSITSRRSYRRRALST
jgi:cytochrome oxidase Cu insertion factor (SCO1/SenC/PrrC family)